MARKKHSAKFKARVALEAMRNDLTTAQIAKKYEVHPTMVNKWKADLIAKSDVLFQGNGGKNKKEKNHTDYLERKIGQLTIENDFLKKNWASYLRKSE